MASLSESLRPRAVAFQDAEDVDSGNLGRLSMGAEPLAAQHPHVDTQHHSLYSLLVIAQRNKLGFTPIRWEPGREGRLGFMVGLANIYTVMDPREEAVELYDLRRLKTGFCGMNSPFTPGTRSKPVGWS
jgi:hypothetical protein